MKKRVVITGYSLLTPLGENINESFINVEKKKSNFQRFKDLNLKEINEYPEDLYISLIQDEKYNLEKYSHRFINTRSSKFARKSFSDCLKNQILIINKFFQP